MQASGSTCVVGGGPAGIMLAYLLARAGVPVTVLEKHQDFFRDFRGDTVHPSTLQLMQELGILSEFLQQPHQRVHSVRATIGDYTFEAASLKGLKISTPYIALMPQWDFLNFLSSKARAYPEFTLLMEHQATALVERDGRVSGVVAKTPEGERTIEADLVIACDGRHSIMREQAQLPLEEIGVPIDVLWFRLSKLPNDQLHDVMGLVNYGKMLIFFDRGDYFQAGLVIEKGGFEPMREQGLDAFRTSLLQLLPQLGERVEEVKTWDDVKLLTVQVNRLTQWSRPGLLCIGDAAHAMSPVFGVGVNLAVQDAVATANILADALRQGRSPDNLLERVRERRMFPTEGTQTMQVFVHKGLQTIFQQKGPMHAPLALKFVAEFPGRKQLLARVVGMGLRPEHIHTPDVH